MKKKWAREKMGPVPNIEKWGLSPFLLVFLFFLVKIIVKFESSY
jgi:hypothetical protein